MNGRFHGVCSVDYGIKDVGGLGTVQKEKGERGERKMRKVGTI